MITLKKYKDWLDETVNVLSYHKELDPKFWDEDDHLDPKIREKLLKIARDFYESAEIDAEILDILFMGSMCNYNYTELSDLDTHIEINFEDIKAPTEIVKKAVDGQRFIWNLRHNIVIRGHDVELYIQDVTEKKPHAGIYSLVQDKWLQKPPYNPPKVTDEEINPKYNAYVYDITELEKILENETDIDEIEKYYLRCKEIKHKLGEARKQGIKEQGEFSVENLVFKKLRNEGFIGKLINVKTGLYDKMFAQ